MLEQESQLSLATANLSSRPRRQVKENLLHPSAETSKRKL